MARGRTKTHTQVFSFTTQLFLGQRGAPLADALTWEGGVGHKDITGCRQTRHGIWLVTAAWVILEWSSVWLGVAARGPVLWGSGAHLKPLVLLLCRKQKQTAFVTET